MNVQPAGSAAKVVIVGAGGHGRVCLDVALAAGFDVLDFSDPKRIGQTINGIPVLEDGGSHLASSLSEDVLFHIAVGEPGTAVEDRTKPVEIGAPAGDVDPPEIDYLAFAALCEGSVVMAGVVINANARIGRACIINTRALIDHDCVLGDGVQLGPAATLAGDVTVGDHAAVLTGAVLIPGVRIGRRAVVAAGSVVIKNVAETMLAAGPPARPLRALGGGAAIEAAEGGRSS